jgi:hypothetical protein
MGGVFRRGAEFHRLPGVGVVAPWRLRETSSVQFSVSRSLSNPGAAVKAPRAEAMRKISSTLLALIFWVGLAPMVFFTLLEAALAVQLPFAMFLAFLGIPMLLQGPLMVIPFLVRTV